MRGRRGSDGPIQAAETPGRKGAWKAVMPWWTVRRSPCSELSLFGLWRGYAVGASPAGRQPAQWSEDVIGSFEFQDFYAYAGRLPCASRQRGGRVARPARSDPAHRVRRRRPPRAGFAPTGVRRVAPVRRLALQRHDRMRRGRPLWIGREWVCRHGEGRG
jgi:hypothetical protein